jgi:hypothetical protein
MGKADWAYSLWEWIRLTESIYCWNGQGGLNLFTVGMNRPIYRGLNLRNKRSVFWELSWFEVRRRTVPMRDPVEDICRNCSFPHQCSLWVSPTCAASEFVSSHQRIRVHISLSTLAAPLPTNCCEMVGHLHECFRNGWRKSDSCCWPQVVNYQWSGRRLGQVPPKLALGVFVNCARDSPKYSFQKSRCLSTMRLEPDIVDW